MKRRPLFKSSIALGMACLILGTPITSWSWGAGGHMMTAQIAYNRLNPRAKAKANALLAIPINPAEVSAKSPNFIDASHWADDLRPFKEFDPFKELHFVDYPFSLDGTPLPETPTPNIITALQENVQILKTSTDQNAQAQALRLIIHFVGDIHQPLHCVSRVDKTNPKGDLGGNLVTLMIPGKDGQSKKTNLHSYWDGGIGAFPPTGPNFAPPPLNLIPPAAAKARAGNPVTARALKLNDPMNFKAWSDESFALARDVAYKGITNGGTPTAAYNAAALKVANRRVAWGGYRLAALLNSIWP